MTMRKPISRAERERQRKVAVVSQARLGRYRAITDDPVIWWDQMQTVAAELGVSITWDEVQARPSGDGS
jgi:hypothetical protein